LGAIEIDVFLIFAYTISCPRNLGSAQKKYPKEIRTMFNRSFVMFFILAVILAFAFYTNQAEALLVEKGLVGYWSFNEIKNKTVKDNWADNDGTLQGPENAKGKYGNALIFDGQDDYVNCGNDSSLDITDAISIEAWVYMESAGNYPTVVSKSGANWGYIFEFKESTRQINLYLDGGVNGWDGPAETGVPLEKWTHLAATYDGKTLQYYLNGNPDGTYAKGGKIASNQDNVHIGGRKIGEPYHFDGIIDEVRIYNRALDEPEVKMNMDFDGAAVNPTDKVAVTWGDIKVFSSLTR